MWPNRSFLRIWSHLLQTSLMENFIFCAMYVFTSANKGISVAKLSQTWECAFKHYFSSSQAILSNSIYSPKIFLFSIT